MVLRRNTGHTGISRRPFFASLGIYILIPYLLGTYTYYLLEETVLVPLHWKQFLLYLSPSGFHFHMIGIMI
jgi:ACR3 family arsenite efflux pump ArsB